MQVQAWSSIEEGGLWKILEELDRVDAKNIKAKQKKEAMKVAKARSKMGVGKSQPGIMDLFAKSSQTTRLCGANLDTPSVCSGRSG